MYQLRAWLIATSLVTYLGCKDSVRQDDAAASAERDATVELNSDAAIGGLQTDAGADAGTGLEPAADGGEADAVPAADGGGVAGGGGAAGGGGGPVAGEPSTQPVAGSSATAKGAVEVASSVPGDRATLDDLNQPLRLEFTAEIDASSVRTDTIEVTRSKQPVPGQWVTTGRQATFTPSLAWALGSSYEVALSSDVRSADARALAPARFSFEVRDGQWSTETIGPAWNRTDVSVSRNGRAAVIWADLTDTLGSGGVYLKTWKPENGWSQPSRVSVETTQVLAPSVAINDAGHVVGAYSFTIAAFARGSLDGTTWTEPGYLGTAGGREVSRPDFVVNAEGRAFGLVSTYHVNPEVTTVDGNALSLQTGALTPFSISNREGGVDSGAQVALYRGAPVVVWQEGGGQPGIWLMEGAPEGARSQLSAAETITESPAVATSDEAEAIVVAWVQHDEATSSIWVARRAGDAPFEPAQKVSTGTASARSPAIAIDAQGRALVVWEQDAEAGTVAVYAAEFRPDANSWTSPEEISVRSARAVKPTVVREPGGNAIAAWVHSEMAAEETVAATVFALRFVADEGWLEESRAKLSSAENGAINNISLGTDGSGRAVLGWVDGGGVHVGRFE